MATSRPQTQPRIGTSVYNGFVQNRSRTSSTDSASASGNMTFHSFSLAHRRIQSNSQSRELGPPASVRSKDEIPPQAIVRERTSSVRSTIAVLGHGSEDERPPRRAGKLHDEDNPFSDSGPSAGNLDFRPPETKIIIADDHSTRKSNGQQGDDQASSPFDLTSSPTSMVRNANTRYDPSSDLSVGPLHFGGETAEADSNVEAATKSDAAAPPLSDGIGASARKQNVRFAEPPTPASGDVSRRRRDTEAHLLTSVSFEQGEDSGSLSTSSNNDTFDSNNDADNSVVVHYEDRSDDQEDQNSAEYDDEHESSVDADPADLIGPNEQATDRSSSFSPPRRRMSCKRNVDQVERSASNTSNSITNSVSNGTAVSALLRQSPGWTTLPDQNDSSNASRLDELANSAEEAQARSVADVAAACALVDLQGSSPQDARSSGNGGEKVKNNLGTAPPMMSSPIINAFGRSGDFAFDPAMLMQRSPASQDLIGDSRAEPRSEVGLSTIDEAGERSNESSALVRAGTDMSFKMSDAQEIKSATQSASNSVDSAVGLGIKLEKLFEDANALIALTHNDIGGSPPAESFALRTSQVNSVVAIHPADAPTKEASSPSRHLRGREGEQALTGPFTGPHSIDTGPFLIFDSMTTYSFDVGDSFSFHADRTSRTGSVDDDPGVPRSVSISASIGPTQPVAENDGHFLTSSQKTQGCEPSDSLFDHEEPASSVRGGIRSVVNASLNKIINASTQDRSGRAIGGKSKGTASGTRATETDSFWGDASRAAIVSSSTPPRNQTRMTFTASPQSGDDLDATSQLSDDDDDDSNVSIDVVRNSCTPRCSTPPSLSTFNESSHESSVQIFDGFGTPEAPKSEARATDQSPQPTGQVMPAAGLNVAALMPLSSLALVSTPVPVARSTFLPPLQVYTPRTVSPGLSAFADDNHLTTPAERGRFEHHRSPPSPPPLNPICNVYISGLRTDTTDEILFDIAKSAGGQIVSHKAIIDPNNGACKGFGFVMYRTAEQAAHAIKFLNTVGYQASLAKQSFTSRLRRFAEKDSSNLYLHG